MCSQKEQAKVVCKVCKPATLFCIPSEICEAGAAAGLPIRRVEEAI